MGAVRSCHSGVLAFLEREELDEMEDALLRRNLSLQACTRKAGPPG